MESRTCLHCGRLLLLQSRRPGCRSSKKNLFLRGSECTDSDRCGAVPGVWGFRAENESAVGYPELGNRRGSSATVFLKSGFGESLWDECSH